MPQTVNLMHCGIHRHVYPEALTNANIVILLARPKHNTAAHSLEEGLGTARSRVEQPHSPFTCSLASCSPSSYQLAGNCGIE